MNDQRLEKHLEEIKGLLVALLIVAIVNGIIEFWSWLAIVLNG